MGGNLDVATLLNFSGSGSAYVTRGYNQGTLGSAGDLTQGTAAYQPRIVNAGVLETQNGLPAMNFGWTTGPCFFNTPAALCPSGTQSSAINIVATYETDSSTTGLFNDGRGSIPVFSSSVRIDGGGAAGPSGIAMPIGAAQIVTGLWTSTSVALYQDGSNTASKTFSAYSVTQSGGRIGQGGSTGYWPGKIQEFVAWLVAPPTADQHGVEHNQEAYYGISGV